MARSKYIQSVLKAAGGRPKSTQWFRDKIKEFGTPKSADLIRDGKRTSKPTFGILNMFVYDPKLKDKLPYYDTFPLVLPIEEYNNGFLGINLHYLSVPMRIRLLDRLTETANNKKFDDAVYSARECCAFQTLSASPSSSKSFDVSSNSDLS